MKDFKADWTGFDEGTQSVRSQGWIYDMLLVEFKLLNYSNLMPLSPGKLTPFEEIFEKATRITVDYGHDIGTTVCVLCSNPDGLGVHPPKIVATVPAIKWKESTSRLPKEISCLLFPLRLKF